MDLLCSGILEPGLKIQKLKGSDVWDKNNKAIEAGVNLTPE